MSKHYTRNMLIALLRTLRPLLGEAKCRFPTGCTSFAVKQLQDKNPFIAFYFIAKRLLICSPFHFLFSIQDYCSVL